MPPPKESTRLRASKQASADELEDALEIQEAKPDTPRDKWAAGREAMREQLATAAQPSATAHGAAGQDQVAAEAKGTSQQPGATPASGDQAAKPRQRSRYADQIKTITPEERRQVEALVASVGVVNKVISVSAF